VHSWANFERVVVTRRQNKLLCRCIKFKEGALLHVFSIMFPTDKVCDDIFLAYISMCPTIDNNTVYDRLTLKFNTSNVHSDSDSDDDDEEPNSTSRAQAQYSYHYQRYPEESQTIRDHIDSLRDACRDTACSSRGQTDRGAAACAHTFPQVFYPDDISTCPNCQGLRHEVLNLLLLLSGSKLQLKLVSTKSTLFTSTKIIHGIHVWAWLCTCGMTVLPHPVKDGTSVLIYHCQLRCSQVFSCTRELDCTHCQ
jgi:hypothetical protein